MEKKQVLLVGLGTEGQKIKTALAGSEIQVLEADSSAMALTIGQLFGGEGENSGETLSPTVIMFRGFSREELDGVLADIRKAGLSHQPLKAMVTPTNWSWKFGSLYGELQQEQQVMGALIRLKQLRDSMPMPDFRDIPAMKAWMQVEVLMRGGEDTTVEAIESAYRELKRYQK